VDQNMVHYGSGMGIPEKKIQEGASCKECSGEDKYTDEVKVCRTCSQAMTVQHFHPRVPNRKQEYMISEPALALVSSFAWSTVLKTTGLKGWLGLGRLRFNLLLLRNFFFLFATAAENDHDHSSQNCDTCNHNHDNHPRLYAIVALRRNKVDHDWGDWGWDFVENIEFDDDRAVHHADNHDAASGNPKQLSSVIDELCLDSRSEACRISRHGGFGPDASGCCSCFNRLYLKATEITDGGQLVVDLLQGNRLHGR